MIGALCGCNIYMNQGVMVEWWGLDMKCPQPKDSYTKDAAHNGTFIKGEPLTNVRASCSAYHSQFKQ